jgi:hypothetical protein
MQELLRILQSFARASIRAIPYKGPVLAASVYNNVSLREFCDLDILVDAPDVTRAAELLVANGYRCQIQLTAAQTRAYLSSGCELGFERGGISVELHWRIAPRTYSLPFSFPELWERRQTVSFGEQIIATLSVEDSLLVLCVHAMKHNWNSLSFVTDVAELLRTAPQLDWRVAIERAEQMGARRVLLLGLLLAHELVTAPLPEAVRVAVRDDRCVRRLVPHVLGKLRMHNAPAEFSLADHVFFLRARERMVDKARYIFYALFTPDLADWNLRKSEMWLPLYRFARLWRVLKKFAPKIGRVARLESAK